MIWWYIFLPLIIISASTKALNLPSAKFLTDFALAHQQSNILLHLPAYVSAKQCMNWSKDISFKQNTNIFLAFVTSSNNLTTWHNKDLHVFIPDEFNLEQSMNDFFHLYSLRNGLNHEYWLLDISLFNSAFEASERKLKYLPNLDLNDDLYLFEEKGHHLLKIWEFYEIDSTLPRQLLPYGMWNDVDRLKLTKATKWMRRKDLKGMQLKTQTLPVSFYITKMIPTKDNPDEYEIRGFFAEVWFALQDIMNFTYTTTKPKDGSFGSLQEDGSWTGMVGNLINHEVDIAVTPLYQTVRRDNVVSFSIPIYQAYTQLFIQNPGDSISLGKYIQPLTWLAWTFIGIFCLIVPVFMYITANYGLIEPASEEFTLSKSFVIPLRGLILLGWAVTPTKISSRLVFLIILSAGYILYLQWEAMLISFLAARNIILPFVDIESLLKDSDYQIAAMPGTSMVDDFRSSQDPIMKQAWEERFEPNFESYKTLKVGYGAGGLLPSKVPLEIPKTVMYMFDANIKPTQEFQQCKIIALPKKYVRNAFSYGFQKDSPLLKIFNYYLAAMTEEGSLNRIVNSYAPAPQICPDNTGKPLGYESLIFVFLVMISGIGLVFVILMVEWMISKLKIY